MFKTIILAGLRLKYFCTSGSVLLFSFRSAPFIKNNDHLKKYDIMEDLNYIDGCTVSDKKNVVKNLESMKSKMEILVLATQKRVCTSLSEIEGNPKAFSVNKWTRPGGGGGVSYVLEDGKVFERAAVLVSVVFGKANSAAVRQMTESGSPFADSRPKEFFAAGISSVIHPRNPYVPTYHFNYRYFEVISENNERVSWFGGGADITPYYVDEDDFIHFHKTLKSTCDLTDRSFYPRFKKWCDRYFFIAHRNEARGVGGIFFDDLKEPNIDTCFQFIVNCTRGIIPAYAPIVTKNCDKFYGEKERKWQLIRRGRYVEFNLIYDRGTKFGLATPGSRVESILCSMPRVAEWKYMYEPKKDSPEGKLLEILRNPREWV